MRRLILFVFLLCLLDGCGWLPSQLTEVERIAIAKSKEGVEGFVVVKDDARLPRHDGETATLRSRVRRPVIQLLNSTGELINQIELPPGKVDYFFQQNLGASGKFYFAVGVNEMFDSERANPDASYENPVFWIHDGRLERMMVTEDGTTRVPFSITGATRAGTNGTVLEVICDSSRKRGTPVFYNRYAFENNVLRKKSKSTVVACPAYYKDGVAAFPPESDFPE